MGLREVKNRGTKKEERRGSVNRWKRRGESIVEGKEEGTLGGEERRITKGGGSRERGIREERRSGKENK